MMNNIRNTLKKLCISLLKTSLNNNHHIVQADKNKFTLVTKYRKHNLTSEKSDETRFSDV